MNNVRNGVKRRFDPAVRSSRGDSLAAPPTTPRDDNNYLSGQPCGGGAYRDSAPPTPGGGRAPLESGSMMIKSAMLSMSLFSG